MMAGSGVIGLEQTIKQCLGKEEVDVYSVK